MPRRRVKRRPQRGLDRIVPALLGLVVLTLNGACRSGSSFYARPRPRPVPTDPRSGWAHYLLQIESRARHRVRVGEDGPWIPAGGRVVVDRSLPPASDDMSRSPREDLVELVDASGRRELLRVPIPIVHSTLADERRIPLPRIAGRAPRITAGIHAAHHRQPGRRLALDLVPSGSTPARGAEVESPVDALVVAVRRHEPDRPGGRPNEILLRRDDGSLLLLSHFEQGSIPWRPDQRVRRGQVLGRIGLSGETSGAHLHVELLELGPRRSRR